jgi:acetyl-CoA C-acetyltransferase
VRKAVIISAKRTPIGRKGGVFKNVPPERLVAALIENIMKETKLNPSELDDVIIGNAFGPGGNLARLSALTAGLPVSVPGVTVDRQCGSGLEAINLAARFVQSGAGDIYLAGGVESASQEKWYVDPEDPNQEVRKFHRARFSPDEIGDPEMGEAAENVAEKYSITREEQDAFALNSYQKTITSKMQGHYKDEIVPVKVATDLHINDDESPRVNINVEKVLKRSIPAFRENGSVTAANSCGVNDGAALTLIMSVEKAKKLGLQPSLEFVDAVTMGVDPNYLGVGPVSAMEKLLKRTNLTMDKVDLVEFNEAFAAQVVASLKLLNIPWDKVNQGGGAIAYGHPYGASGAILVTRLLAEMLQQKHALYGVAMLGVGGGLGIATLLRKAEI